MFQVFLYAVQFDSTVNIYKLEQFSLGKIVTITLEEGDIEDQITSYLYKQKIVKKKVVIVLVKL